MPRKSRAIKPTLAESFFEWFESAIAKRDDWSRISCWHDPIGSWEVDQYIPLLLEKGSNEEVREIISRAQIAAIFLAQEFYQRRQEIEIHRQRVLHAESLISSSNQFLRYMSKDRATLGYRNDSMQFDYQIPDDRVEDSIKERNNIEHYILKLIPLLENFISDRKQLKLPPGDKTDILAMIFISKMEDWALELYQPLNAADKNRFMLAAWRDARLPMPLRDQADEPEAWTEWMSKKLIAWQKMAPEKKRAIGLSEDD